MKSAKTSKTLPPDQAESLLLSLQSRFEKNLSRHSDISWTDVRKRLAAHPGRLWSLHEMETTGGEPDVISHDPASGAYTFFDCSPESPKGRYSLCYDRAGLESRKEHRPKNTAIDLAESMGVDLLTEEQYRHLQTLGEFDLKTSSWILTPPAIRKLGGALFCDRRFDHVFTYHNGAQSYYAGRGFRASLKV
jgi:hypothetical protein